MIYYRIMNKKIKKIEEHVKVNKEMIVKESALNK